MAGPRSQLATLGMVLLLALLLGAGQARAERDMYCGEQNCYAVLGLDASASQKEIKKAYRRLSLAHHPDREGGDEALFVKIAAANEVLGDDSRRADYDYFLAHPEEHLYNSFRYYRAQTDLRVVSTGLVILLSGLHYGLLWERYQRKAGRLPLVETRVQQLLSAETAGSSKKRNKQQAPTEVEALLRRQVLDALDAQGAFCKPRVGDIFVFSIARGLVRLPQHWQDWRKANQAARVARAEQEAEAERRAEEETLKRQESERRIREAKLTREAKREQAREKERKAEQDLANAEAEARRERKQRKQLASDLASLAGALSLEEFTKDDLRYLCNSPQCPVDKLLEFKRDLESGRDGKLSDLEVNRLVVTARKQARKAYQAREQELRDLASSSSSSSSSSTVSNGDAGSSGDAWTDAELAVLAKAIAKYPGGTRNRWVTVSNMVNATSCAKMPRSEQECAAQAAKIKRAGMAAAAGALVGAAGSHADQDDSDEAWTLAQQSQLESGLARYAKLPDPKEKWQSIAVGVPGRSAKECAQRYQSLREKILSRRKAAAE